MMINRKTMVVVTTMTFLTAMACATAAGSERNGNAIAGQTPGVNERIVEAARLYGEARKLNLKVPEPRNWLLTETDRRLSLLRRAREELIRITKEHPGSAGAVAVLSGQAFGTMSLPGIELMIEELIEAQCLRHPTSGCILKLVTVSIQAVEDTRTREGLLAAMSVLLERFELKKLTSEVSCHLITMGCQIGRPGYCFSPSKTTVSYVQWKQAENALPDKLPSKAIPGLGRFSWKLSRKDGEWTLASQPMGGVCDTQIIHRLRKARALEDPEQRTEAIRDVIGDIENKTLVGVEGPILANKHCKPLLAEIAAVRAPRLRAELLMAAFPYHIANASLGGEVSAASMAVLRIWSPKSTKFDKGFVDMFRKPVQLRAAR